MKANIKFYRPKFIEQILLERENAAEPRICLECPNVLPSYSKSYCSGFCLNKSKAPPEVVEEVPTYYTQEANGETWEADPDKIPF